MCFVVFTSHGVALTSEQKRIYDKQIYYYDVADCSGVAQDTPDSDTSNSPGSLGGVYGTGVSKSDLKKIKKFAKKGLSVKEGKYTGTAYGPPWNSMEGSGITSTGISLTGPRYVVASDPDNRLPYGSLVKITPNPYNWDGPFVVADTGGAFHGAEAKVDFYDWKGRAHQNKWGERDVQVSKYNEASESFDETNVDNNVLGSENSCACESSGAGSATLSGDNNIEKAFNYLKGKKIDDVHAAAILGNFMQESSMNPKAVNSSSGATGIAQWLGGRLDGLKSKAGKDYLELDKQLDYLWYEMQGPEKAATTKFLATKDLRDAAASWGDDWERAGAGEMNHANRYAQAKIIYKKYGGGSVSDADINSPGSCTATGASSVNADGYAFPVGLPKNQITNWGSPWCRDKCHHDGTPAMDITKKGFGNSVTGTSIHAIVDGTIQNQHIYNGISGCYSLQLKGKDGWSYYYTHMRKPTQDEGAKVKAGDKIAEVGERKCTGNGSDPHLHIDRGKPKGSPGGYECCRDNGFVQLMDKLYDELK